jgi:hypothetical protein
VGAPKDEKGKATSTNTAGNKPHPQ